MTPTPTDPGSITMAQAIAACREARIEAETASHPNLAEAWGRRERRLQELQRSVHARIHSEATA
jgi:hypothetical protein